MTDSNGVFLGSGFSDIKENKLFYKENVRFREKGDYLFKVRQAMRERNKIEGISLLKGVSDVGISIELINN
jgi:gliding motility-associated lipoprotein GldH